MATRTRLAHGDVAAEWAGAGGRRRLATSGILASAELYDPATGMWTATGSMATARDCTHGDVAAEWAGAGGRRYRQHRPPIPSAELYDPASGTWTATANLNPARFDHTATLLRNGKVLVAGGQLQ